MTQQRDPHENVPGNPGRAPDDPLTGGQHDPHANVPGNPGRNPHDPAGDDKPIGEKISEGAESVAGKAKEKWGELTDDERLEAEGRLQRAEAERERERQTPSGDNPLR